MPTFRYVLADVFTDTPLAGNQLAVFTDAREIPEESLQRARARDEPLGDGLRLPADGRGRPREDPDLHAGSRGAVRGPSRRSARRSSSPAAPARSRSGSRPAAGSCRCCSSARARGSSSGGWSSRSRRSRPFEDTALLFEALGVEGSELPVEVYDNGLQHLFVTLGSPAEVAALKPDLGALAELGEVLGINTIAGSGTSVEDADVRPGAAASPRIRRPARRPARSRSISPATAGSPSARRSRSRRASRSAARRRSTRAWTAARSGSSGSRSAAARSSSRAASSGSRSAFRVRHLRCLTLERNGLDLRQLDGQPVPEAAAVAGEVEAVARGVQDEIGVLVRNGDGPAGGEPAARLAPGAPGVVGDDERRLRLDDGDDGRACARGGDAAAGARPAAGRRARTACRPPVRAPSPRRGRRGRARPTVSTCAITPRGPRESR